MPELPEVETVRRGLAEPLLGRRFATVTVREPRLRWPVPADLPRQLKGRRVEALGRRGKYLLVDCGAGTLIVHLGMSGSLRVLPGPAPAARHDHLDLGLDDGRVLRYTDPRRFGAVLWTREAPEAHPLLAGLGPEPLDPAWSGAALHAALSGKRVAIKLALMDGRVVVGVGNIYANEALFRAGIRPTGAAGRLSAARCERLAGAVKTILEAAIAAGGSTLRDFTDAAGHPGWFQQQYAVYDRAGEPCPQCGGPVRGIRQGQRSTFYCPGCQR